MPRRLKTIAFAAAALSTMSASALAQDPFLGEIATFGMNFCPKGWAQTNGQLLPINQNQALFALLGTQFGGDGRVNFALPDFRGRVRVGAGQGGSLSPYVIGEAGGAASVTLTTNELPLHAHLVSDLGVPPTVRVKNSNGPAALVETSSAAAAIDSSSVGGGQAHNNMQPYLVMTTCIALIGVFPSRN